MKLIDLLVQELPKRGGWPEGAVECCWFRDEKDLDFFDINGNWDRQPINPFDLSGIVFEPNEGTMQEIKKHEYESALSASQQSAWNGEGLPPVGCNFEYGNHRTLAKCLGVGNDMVFACKGRVGEDEYEEFMISIQDSSFHKPRSEAERKRQEIIECLYKVNGIRARDGGKQSAVDVYEAIAAGKIPGVKLAD